MLEDAFTILDLTGGILFSWLGFLFCREGPGYLRRFWNTTFRTFICGIRGGMRNTSRHATLSRSSLLRPCVAAFTFARFARLVILGEIIAWFLGNPPNATDHWSGNKCTPLDALAVRHLETHLFKGNLSIMGNGVEFLVASAPGIKHRKPPKRVRY